MCQLGTGRQVAVLSDLVHGYHILSERFSGVTTRDHNIWVGTKQGVAQIEIGKDDLIWIDKQDGLPSNEVTALYADKEDLWIGTPKGLVRFRQQDIRKNNNAPPIYITENGTCDASDDFRSKFIFDHLKALTETIESGIPIERYYHWTLTDNFEWVEGYNARFGLYHNDFKTQVRTLRKSGQFYASICKTRQVVK